MSDWDRLFPSCGGPAPAVLRLRAADAETIRAAARAGWPHETCGLLVGEGEAVRRVVPADNVAERAHDRFEIDPRARLALMKSLRGTPERVIGHWHSHPDHPARPSATDLAQAHEPGLVWLICAVDRTGGTDLTAWRVAGEGAARRFEPVDLRVVED